MTELGHGSNVMGIETQVLDTAAFFLCLHRYFLQNSLLYFAVTLPRCFLQATYDEETGEFVINTPTDTASKFWIGGAAQHGKVSHVVTALQSCLSHPAGARLSNS